MSLLIARQITKSFPGVHALRSVDLTVNPGEVLALVGENGAGKSTFIRILAGAFPPDSGALEMDGAPIQFRNPMDAQRAGIAVIHQELNLAPALSAADNIFLGRETGEFLPRARERNMASEFFARLGIEVDPDSACRTLSIAQQQAVEIAKALSFKARILILDEPTAALTPSDAERLFAVISDLKRAGMGIVYVSHRLEEVFAIADRIAVLRDGALVDCRATREFTRHQLIERMVGRQMDQEFPARQSTIGDVRLRVSGLSGGKVRDTSFSVRRGEVLGLTGLVGAGRTETLRLLFGAERASAGDVTLDGKPLKIRSPRDAIRNRIALLTEDRKAQGLVLAHSVSDNFGLPNLAHFVRHGFLWRDLELAALHKYVQILGIKLSHPGQPVRLLSGGNQQKVVLAKWLERNCEIILLDEPTRGVDVGAKFEIYQLINQLAACGKSIVVASSEFAEVLGICDRVLVMHEGRIRGEISDPRSATQQDILNLALAA